MVNPWVQLPNSQGEELSRPADKAGKLNSGIIREALSGSVKKKDYLVGMVSPLSAKGVKR